MSRGGRLIASGLPIAAAACLVLAPLSSLAAGAQAAIVFTSPTVPADEGYATDGSSHFLFSASKIVEENSGWKVVATNAKALAGLPAGVNHIGDGAYFDGRLYAPVEHWSGCGNFTHQTIAIYNALDPRIPLIAQKDISVVGQEISSISLAPSKDELYTSSYCDGSKLMVYDMGTLTLKGTITLDRNIPEIQGISWNKKHQEFALTSDNLAGTVGYVYLVSPQGQVTGPIYTTPALGEMEGVDYTQDTIRFLIAQHIYYLRPGSLPN